MSKLERWLTLVANLSVVFGIIFLAAEMRQNTEAIQAQTRDAITEKQMTFLASVYTNLDVADIYQRGASGEDLATPAEGWIYSMAVGAQFREWENSFYQYERGLFSGEEFEGRRGRWRSNLRMSGYRRIWANIREGYAPSFRDEIDRMVAEVERGQ